MAARKLQQEIERCFKQVDLGVEAFDSQYEKYDQSTNASQRDKLVENIKKECKKLQRLRDQIKTWAAGSEVKDKGPLQDKRELIESKMEAFKAVEKEMKTKAFSKEGLLANAKLDPREREKEELSNFIQDMVDKLSEQIESQEAATEQLLAQAKKSKKGDAGKVERVAELEHKTERHKWHQSRLELLRRRLENDDVEPDGVKGAEDDIRNYVENNSEVDFYEDDGIYDDFNLDEEVEALNALADRERTSSQDNGDDGDDLQETVSIPDTAKSKSKPAGEATAGGRRPSQHIKSPLPTLATLHTLPTTVVPAATTSMKPAPPPPKPLGETLKYASAAAAAAAASETTSIGIAPLPPPPVKAAPPPPVAAVTPVPVAATLTHTTSSSAAPSPAVPTIEPVAAPVSLDRTTSAVGGRIAAVAAAQSPAVSLSSISVASPAVIAQQPVQAIEKEPASASPAPNGVSLSQDEVIGDRDSGFESEATSPEKYRAQPVQTNGVDHLDRDEDEDESIYHLPASLRELLEAYDSVKSNALPISSPAHQRMMNASFASRPDTIDAEKPRHYKPTNPALYTPGHYPQDPLPIFDDPRLYSKIDTDALFYSFYYRQGSYQQYLAARSLKGQSWRFHKQYQTWFQRHEEPQSITEDFEKGTYRFFDYESTWMNRRKANFNFEYKFLEDDL